jgi:ribosomal protein L32
VEAERLRMQLDLERKAQVARIEAEEMRMKGYTYQQETSRQLGLEAVRSLGESGGNMAGGTLNGVMGMAGDMMQLGVGLGAVGSVIGMTKDAITPVINATGSMMQQAAATGWNCSCGESNIQSKFCPNCGSKRPEPESGWKCPSCGKAGITSRFCPECGAKKPEAPALWTCPDCGTSGIRSKFCPECGHKKEE